jgi:hypothetical protein
MAFSFLSKDKSSDQETIRKSPRISAVVRTMKEDMENIKNKGGNQDFDERKQIEIPKKSVQNSSTATPVNPFSEEGERLFQSQVENKTTNPFDTSALPRENSYAKYPPQQDIRAGLVPMTLEGELLSNHLKGKKGFYGIIAVVFVTFILIAGGIYYYYLSENKGNDVVVSDVTVQLNPDTTPENIPKELPYALDKPNYLPINTETVSSLDIKKTLYQAATRIKEASIAQPVEFLVTDQNNNPLAFSRFAYLLKLNLDLDTLTMIDENFSLFIYNDASNMRLGLALTMKNQPTMVLAVSKIENTLPNAFQALILETNINVPKAVIFKSGTYKQFSPRYANLDASQNLSLDYVLFGNHWYIGTSKNTLRAILDVNVK